MFKDAKVGDEVECVLRGRGEIIDTAYGITYLIRVKFPNGSYQLYDFEGKAHVNDLHPSLFPAGTEIPRPKVDTRIRPKEAGELWEHELGTSFFIYNKEHPMAMYNCGRTFSFDKVKTTVHGENGWKRVNPQVD